MLTLFSLMPNQTIVLGHGQDQLIIVSYVGEEKTKNDENTLFLEFAPSKQYNIVDTC